MKRFYLIVGLALTLGAGAVVASRADDSQQDKQNVRKKSEQKEIVAPTVDVGPVTPLIMQLGEGGYLGVFLEEVTADRARELALGEERGAIVMKVVKDGPAEKAGLRENDVIVGFNGRRVDSVRELQRILSETPPNRSVPIEVMRAGARQTVTATLGKRSDEFKMLPELDEKIRLQTEEAVKRAQEQLRNSGEALKRSQELQDQLRLMPRDFGEFNFVGPGQYGFFRGGPLGISVESLTEQLAGYFGVKDGKGVLVTQVDENSAAAKAGLKAGDVIVAVDTEPIDSVNALRRAVGKKAEGQVALRIVRNKSEETITVTIEKHEKVLRQITPRQRAAVSTSAG